MAGNSGTRINYISRVEALAKDNERYLWLLNYLRRDRDFVNGHLCPVRQGNTRTIVADFSKDYSGGVSVHSYTGLGDIKALGEALATRASDTQVRLIFVATISGVQDIIRNQQLSRPDHKQRPDHMDDKDTKAAKAPKLTRPRFPGVLGTHPIGHLGHLSYLPDPDALIAVASALDLDPHLLLCYLDHNEHLAYRPMSSFSRRGQPHVLSVGLDQGNYLMAYIMADPYRELMNQENKGCTVLLLAVEDNCLGIDFNPTTGAVSQVLRKSTDSLVNLFESEIRGMDEEQCLRILKSPDALVWLYTANLTETITCHLELCRREWSALYEPHANSSAIYGDSDSRDFVRLTALVHAYRLRYLEGSMQSLNYFQKASRERAIRCNGRHDRAYGHGSDDGNDDDHSYGEQNSEAAYLTSDLWHFETEVKALRSAYEQFLEQQVSKISLFESRRSALEARNIGRLSYMAFIFVPLSLASSFFSTNIKPLGGKVPLWIFIVTSLAILAFSLFVLLLSSTKIVRNLFSQVQELLVDAFQWTKAFLCCITQPSTDRDDEDSFKLLQNRSEKLQLAEHGPKPTPNTSVHDVNADITNAMIPSLSNSMPSRPIIGKRLESQTKVYPKIPMTDKSRRRHQDKIEKITESARPQPREEQPDSSNADDVPPIQFPAKHRPTKRPTAFTADIHRKKSSSTIAESSFQLQIHDNGQGEPESNANQKKPVEHSKKISRLPPKSPPGSFSSPILESVLMSINSSSPDKTGEMDIYYAAYDGDRDLVSKLLEAGAEFNTRDAEGRDALCVAAENGHLDTVRLLLQEMAWSFDHPAGYQSDIKTTPIPANPLSLAAFRQHEIIMHTLIRWSILKTTEETRRWGEASSTNYLVMEAVVDVCNKHNVVVLKQLITAIDKPWEFDKEYGACLQQMAAQGASGESVDAIPLLVNSITDPQKRQQQLDDCLDIAILTGGDSFDLVQKLIDEGATINRHSQLVRTSRHGFIRGLSPLNVACKYRSEDMVKFLLQRGANVNLASLDTWKPTPLSVAAERGDLTLVTILIDAGANVNFPSVMQAAAISENLDIIKGLIDAGANINIEQVNPENSESFSFDFYEPLQIASGRGCGHMVRFLLQAGITLEYLRDPEHGISKGEAAFAEACSGGHEDIAFLLLDANIHSCGADGVSRFYKSITKDGTLTQIVLNGMVRLLEHLLKAGLEVGWSRWSMCLCDAAKLGNTTTLSILLDHGAQKWISNDNNFGTLARTPLHEAIEARQIDAARLLVDRGADMSSLASYKKETPLHLAARLGYIAGTSILLEHGADISCIDDEGQTPLHAASRAGRIETIGLLLEKGANINARCASGWTPVHFAAWNKHEKAVEFLESAGADMGPTTDGLTVQAFLANDAEIEGSDGWSST